VLFLSFSQKMLFDGEVGCHGNQEHYVREPISQYYVLDIKVTYIYMYGHL